MKRTILLNPGPVTLSDRVRRALTSGDWCHREPEFAALTKSINQSLVDVYASMHDSFDAVMLTGSGTAAVEAMLATFAPDKEKTLVVANGVYGERMARMLELHRKPHDIVQSDWAAPMDLEQVAARLTADAAITAVAAVHHETTTGRRNDIESLGQLCRERGVDLLLDGVSSFGAENVDAGDWNLAAIAGTANKCLHGAPGISFVAAKHSLWSRPRQAAGSLYLDLHGYHAAQHGDGFSPFTQSVQIAFALREALDELHEQGGWSQRQQLYSRRAARIAAVLERCGVRHLLRPEEYSSVLCSYRLPETLQYAAVHDALKHDGFVIYAGQGTLADSVFRIAHMGDIREDDLERLCRSLEVVFGSRAA